MRTDTQIQAILICLLSGICLLFYQPVPGSIDGEAILAVSSNIVQHGTPNMPELAASDSLLPEMSRIGAIGVDGNLYSKKGITPSLLLLPFTALASILPLAGVRAVAMLFNPFITVVTAALLYHFLRFRGHTQKVAGISVILFGTGTLALPYTQTLFGESLAGFLLLYALFEALQFRQKGNIVFALRLAFTLGLLAGVNTIYVLFIPAFFIFAFTGHSQGWHWRAIFYFAVVILSCGLALIMFNMFRFGDPVNSGYKFSAGEGFNYPAGWGVFGLIASPYRGIFWYSPILFVGIYGAIKRFDKTLMMVLIVSVAQILLFASWWSWHGGIVWGPRFVLPAVPLLMLCVAAGVSVLIRSVAGSLLLIVAGVVSAGVQLSGALVDYRLYYEFLYANYGTNQAGGLISGLSDAIMFDVSLSPVMGHVRLLQQGELDIAWLMDGVNFIHLLAVAGVLTLAVVNLFFYRLWRNLIITGLMITLAGVFVAATYHAPQSLPDQINQQLEGDHVLVASSQIGSVLLDIENMRAYSTMASVSRNYAWTSAIWENAREAGGALWFLTWYAPADAENWQAKTLWEKAAFVEERSIGDFRALLFQQDEMASPRQISNARFGEAIRFSRYGYRIHDDWLLLTLEWQAIARPAYNYSFFVHLLDENGAIIAQQDRLPRGGFQSPVTWSPGETVTDHIAFWPSQVQSATQVRLGWVDSRSGKRLPMSLSGDTDMNAEDFFIFDIEIDE
jgi:hypothetical protein